MRGLSAGLCRLRNAGRSVGVVFNRALLGFVLLATPSLVPPLLGQEYHKLYARAAVSTVRIQTDSQEGLAVAIADGKTLVSCKHVVENNRKVGVVAAWGQFNGYVVAENEPEDLVLIRIPIEMEPLKMRTNQEPLPSNSFIMAGGMREQAQSMDMRPGRILGRFRGDFANYMTSCQPKPGFSGGPILDADGYLVGIMKAYAYAKDKTGMEVIPAWKVYALLKEGL